MLYFWQRQEDSGDYFFDSMRGIIVAFVIFCTIPFLFVHDHKHFLGELVLLIKFLIVIQKK